MIKLVDIAYVRSGAADLAGAVRFAAEVVGLQVVPDPDPAVVHLRADHRHHCLTFVAGRSGVLATAFTVSDMDALAAAEVQLHKVGVSIHRGDAEGARSRAVGDYFGFDDPYGNRVELVARQRRSADPVRFGRPNAGITEFGHLCLDAPDLSGAFKFWSTNFSVKVSDWVGDAACLMRIDSVHHKFALFKGDKPALCHMNFQVLGYDDLMRNWNFLRAHDVDIVMGPGRHPTSGSAFVYFKGPEGLTYEYATGTRLIEDDDSWTPRVFDENDHLSIDMWGGAIAPTTRQIQLPDDETAPVDAPAPSGVI